MTYRYHRNGFTTLFVDATHMTEETNQEILDPSQRAQSPPVLESMTESYSNQLNKPKELSQPKGMNEEPEIKETAAQERMKEDGPAEADISEEEYEESEEDELVPSPRILSETELSCSSR